MRRYTLLVLFVLLLSWLPPTAEARAPRTMYIRRVGLNHVRLEWVHWDNVNGTRVLVYKSNYLLSDAPARTDLALYTKPISGTNMLDDYAYQVGDWYWFAEWDRYKHLPEYMAGNYGPYMLDAHWMLFVPIVEM